MNAQFIQVANQLTQINTQMDIMMKKINSKEIGWMSWIWTSDECFTKQPTLKQVIDLKSLSQWSILRTRRWNGPNSNPNQNPVAGYSHCHPPLSNSIHPCVVSKLVVSLMSRRASSNSTSPVGVSDLHWTLRFRRLLRLMPVFSSSMRPLRPSSISMQPRRPDDIQSFQNDV